MIYAPAPRLKNYNGSIEFCKPTCASNRTAETGQKNVSSLIEDCAEISQARKQAFAENRRSEMLGACSSKVASKAGKAVATVGSHSIKPPSANEKNDMLSENTEVLTRNELQDHQTDNSYGSHRKKTRKVRLLTDLLAGDATKSEKSRHNSVPESSAKGDELSAPRGILAIKGNADLERSKKRKMPCDEERAPLELNSPVNLMKKDGFLKGTEKPGGVVGSDSEEDGILKFQFGKRIRFNKASIATTSKKKKKKSTLVVIDDDEYRPFSSSHENVLKDGQRKDGDANNVCAADSVFHKPGQTTFVSKEVYPYPLPPQKLERNSSVWKKKKMDKHNDRQVSPNPWSSSLLRQSPATRKDAEMQQMPSLPMPYLSVQNGFNENGLHHSLGSRFPPTHEYDRTYISPLGSRQLLWPGSTSEETQVLGREIRPNCGGDSSFSAKSEANSLVQRGVRRDTVSNTCTMSVLNEKLQSNRRAGNSSFMQQMVCAKTSFVMPDQYLFYNIMCEGTFCLFCLGSFLSTRKLTFFPFF